MALAHKFVLNFEPKITIDIATNTHISHISLELKIFNMKMFALHSDFFYNLSLASLIIGKTQYVSFGVF